MAKPLLGSVDGDAGTNLPADPRLSAPTPAQWQDTVEIESDGDRPPVASLWTRLTRKLFFWRAAWDRVQVSVFAPPTVTPGQSVNLTIQLHAPEQAESLRTLTRAVQRDVELIGTGFVSCEVVRGAKLTLHLWVANAGVGRSVVEVVWRGRPHKITMNLHVPWESPEGITTGLASVGMDDVLVGKIEFHINLLARKA